MTGNNIVIKVEDLSKQYRLGLVGTGTLSHDLNRWWAQLRGKEDPYLKIGEINKRNESGGINTNEYVWALKDINFEVNQGEVLGIIGKNGAGKSTLLKILSRVTGPTTGSFKAKGRIASLLEVGTGFHPELTGRENIFLNGAMLGMTKTEIRGKLDEIIAFSGVEKYINTPVKRYSSGMYVRLAFAVAAHLDPEILIIDEVLAVGDVEFQKKCLGKMKDVASQGRTVLFVSHNMAAVRELCDRAIVLENGGITFSGSSEEAVDYYLNNASRNNNKAIQTFELDMSREYQTHSVKTMNDKNELTQYFECDEEVRVEVECEIYNKIPGLNGCFVLHKTDGTLVLFSDSFDSPPNPLDSLSVGKHSLIITIPKRLLAPGSYYISFTFGSHLSAKSNYFDVLQNVLTFNLKDSRSKRGERRKGFFSTLLNWRVAEVK